MNNACNFWLNRKIVDMMREVIDEKGIVWVVSVGNEGPALTTLCSPALLDEDITIGKDMGDFEVI